MLLHCDIHRVTPRCSLDAFQGVLHIARFLPLIPSRVHSYVPDRNVFHKNNCLYQDGPSSFGQPQPKTDFCSRSVRLGSQFMILAVPSNAGTGVTRGGNCFHWYFYSCAVTGSATFIVV